MLLTLIGLAFVVLGLVYLRRPTLYRHAWANGLARLFGHG